MKTTHRMLLIASLPALPLVIACGDDGGDGSDEAGDTTTASTGADDGPPVPPGGSTTDGGSNPDGSSDGTPPGGSTDDTAGDTAADTTSDGSTSGGVVGECGNGEVEGAEVCDDANPVDFDACTETCELTPELLAYWRFDELDTAGPLADVVGMYDATWMAGDQVVLGGVQPDEGRGGSLLVTAFEDGSAASAGPIADQEQGTISVWIRNYTIGNPTRATVFWQGLAGGDGWGNFAAVRLGVNDDNTFSLAVNTCLVSSEATLFEGDGWFHVVGTWEPGDTGTDCTLIVATADGVPETVGDNGDGQLPYRSAGTAHIGRADDDDTPNWFRGYIDELMVFDRSLSAIEASALRSVQSEGGHYD